MSDTHAFDSSILSAPTIYGTNSKNRSLYPPIRVHMMSVVLFRRVTRSGDLTSFTPKDLQRRFESCRVDHLAGHSQHIIR